MQNNFRTPVNNKQGFTQHKRKIDRGRGFKRVNDDHVEVYDIDMAAWLHMNNVSIVEAFKIGKESILTFYDPIQNERIAKLSVDWLNSESAKFASCVRQIKKVCLSTGKQRGYR